jgi:hypothetical protein
MFLLAPSFERLSKDERFYFTGKPCKYGHIANRYSCNKECVECRKIKNIALKEKQEQWSKENKDRKNAVCKFQYYKNQEKEQQRTRDKYFNHKDKVTATNNAWKAKNPKIGNHYASLRRKAVRQQTPAWADLNAIKQIYMNCPDGYHVDHIVPLKGKTVSGFHSQHNLQYLPASENQRKFNRLEDSYVYA